MSNPLVIGPDPERQRELAALLMGNMKPIRHWSDGLANAGSAIGSAILENRADERQSQLDAENRKLTADILLAAGGRPEETIEWNRPDASGSTTTIIPGQEPNYQQAMALALLSPDDGVRDFGMRLGVMGMEQDQLAASRARDDAQRQEERQWAMEDRAADRAFRQQMQREQIAARQPQGPFAGNAMDAQARNIVMSADPGSPQYAAAHSYLSQPKTVFQDGQMVTISPDMSWAAPPGQGGRPEVPPAAQPQAPLASGGMSQAPLLQPAYFTPDQGFIGGQAGPKIPPQVSEPLEIAPGVTVRTVETSEERSDREKTVNQAQSQLRTLDAIIEHPQRERGTGIQSMLPTMPGSPVASFDALVDQLGGQAFLQAFESLKGGGHITEIEGVKATQAIARLQTAQSDRDFLESMKELRSVVSRGLAKAQGVPEGDLPAVYEPQLGSRSGQMNRGGAAVSEPSIEDLLQMYGE